MSFGLVVGVFGIDWWFANRWLVCWCLFRLVLALHSFCVECVCFRWPLRRGLLYCWCFDLLGSRLMILCGLVVGVLGVFAVACVDFGSCGVELDFLVFWIWWFSGIGVL